MEVASQGRTASPNGRAKPYQHNDDIGIGIVCIILNGMVIFMINLFLKEVVKLPRHIELDDDHKTLFGECSLEFYGLCDFEDKLQVAPCIGCPYHR